MTQFEIISLPAPKQCFTDHLKTFESAGRKSILKRTSVVQADTRFVPLMQHFPPLEKLQKEADDKKTRDKSRAKEDGGE